MSIQEAEFWSRVSKTETCWLWTGSANEDGYGVIGKYDGETVNRSHRWAWRKATGETLTSHDTICHTCDVRNCVRNDDVGTYELNGRTYPRRGHLYKATQPVNVADRDAKGRGNWAKGERHGSRTKPDSVRAGAKNGNAFITDADVLAICERYMASEDATDIAHSFGFADRTPIFAILSGKTWRHVMRPSYAQIKAARGPAANSLPCIACGTTERQRIAKGLCESCYSLRKRRARGIQPRGGSNHPQAKLTPN